MSVSVNQSAFVLGGATTISLSQMFSLNSGTGNPAFLVLSGLDRNEYTATATGTTGTLSGNGQTARFSSIGGDARALGMVFTYDATSGHYYNSIYGRLDQLCYTASGSLNDLTSLSLFGFGSLSAATSLATDPYGCMSSAQYFGSVDLATQPVFAGSLPAQATPGSIASIATSFIGKAWNKDGCWVLASTIAAEAGTALPLQSTAIGVPGQANGEWVVAFNGPSGQSGNWQSMVTAGDIVVIGNDFGLGHITTCVSGSGSTAMLIDNITYMDNYGRITNLANDGSASDVVVAAPHAASQEWRTVATKNVVIYRLDTPVINVTAARTNLAAGSLLLLDSWFTVTDPARKAITQYQIYDTAPSNSLQVNGVNVAAHSAASAHIVASLSGVRLAAGATACTDNVVARAFNGSYWGDWQTLAVSVTPASAPILVHPTINQSWQQGSRVSLIIPASAFNDPQHQILSYSATLAGGGALPSWLNFDSSTRTFSGTVPKGIAQTLSLTVTATDTSGLSASETFQATIAAKPPLLTHARAAQTWIEGSAVSLTLPADSFADPQGETLRYSASLANGQALPSWLQFNSATGTFTGTAPFTQSYIMLKVTATDTSGLSASETFQVNLTPPPPVLTNQTSSQVWTANQPVSFTLPAHTFTAVPGQSLRYTAAMSGGARLPRGLMFDSATQTFNGIAPAALGSYTIRVTAIDALGLSASETFQVMVSAAAPVVAQQTPTQAWTAGQKVSLTLPTGTFVDPQGETLRYSATQANGQKLPSGLAFNPTNRTFSGTAPITPETLGLTVTATDTSGLSTSENFSVTVQAAAPAAKAIPNWAWTAGHMMNFLLPSGTFTDPQKSALTYAAFQVGGTDQTSWMHFNPRNGDFSGLVPANASGTVGIEVIATNGHGLSSSETFGLTFGSSGTRVAALPFAASPSEMLAIHA